MSSIFEIKSLKCSYKNDQKPVLEIRDLTISEGEMLFFLGASGVGKSTLIESLGLMTDTTSHISDNTISYYTKGSNSRQNIINKWKENSKSLSSFRSEEFSFIFQSTNLFESVSLIDNIILPSFVDDKSDAEARAIELLKVFLPNINNYHTRLAGDLSGGQKQRLAFARALTTKYRVLFCDEPTGNLDFGNAGLVMSKLKEKIISEASTALIVTHDIRLAVEHASRIILMTKENRSDGSSFGFVSIENQFKKVSNNIWRTHSSEMSNAKMIKLLEDHFKNCIDDE